MPLHRRRLFRRTYNQAGLLARHLARLSARPWQPDLLRRIRSTPAQGRMNRRARFRNIARAFDLRPGGRALVAGKAVLLVDDVLTTGATVQECARLLRRAGARRVDVLTLARVVLDDAE